MADGARMIAFALGLGTVGWGFEISGRAGFGTPTPIAGCRVISELFQVSL